MTALPARPLLSEPDGHRLADHERRFSAYRRLARLSTGAATAGVYLIHEPDRGAEAQAICEGMGDGDHSGAAMLARRVMMAGEALVLSAHDEPEVAHQDDHVAAFLGVPIGSARTRFRGCLCVMDGPARGWTQEHILALGDIAAMIERDFGRRPVVEERYALETVVRMLAKAVDNMQLGVTITDLEGQIVYTNPAEARMHGFQVNELLGRNARLLGPPEHFRAVDSAERSQAASWTRETVNVRQDGSRFEVLLWSDLVTDAAGNAVGMVTCCEDITERKRTEKSLRDVAMRDPLTMLPNRAHFQERLAAAIERQRRNPVCRFAVLFLDLDRFKVVNDSLGHHVGDELLRVVASRLLACVRPPDTVARFGGDEFALLLDDVGAGETALRVAERILQALAAPVELSGYELVTSVSIGIVQSAAHMSRPEYIWQAADMAMYRAKANGTGRFEVFDRAMHLDAMSRLKVESDLRRAIERGEFRLDYQPVVDLTLGQTVGFEALLRWDHPERGEVLPVEFLGVAEETGLILRLGEWVIREACLEARRWQDHARGRLPWVGVNLSAKQLAQPRLTELVGEALADAGITADLLKFEITETAVMDGAEAAMATLIRLKEAGVQLFLDDFGTGYSSLSYLHRLPIDAVKIDRSFVSEMTPGDRRSRVVEGVVRLARSADLRVIAEGVSDADQLEALANLGCDMAQGYLFAPALRPEMVAEYLRADF